MGEHAGIRVVHRSGSKLNFRPPVITNDSKFLLCASGECVKVFSTSTEECIHNLRGHTDLVTGVHLNPCNHLQAYSCSTDGTLRLWDFMDGILIKTYLIKYKIYSMYTSAYHKGVIFIIAPVQDSKGSEVFQLLALHLPQSGDQTVEASQLSVVLEDVSSNPAAVSLGRGGEYIASIKCLQLEVFFFKKQKSYRLFLKVDNKKGAKNTFTCVTCHPKDDCIATGHEDGKIRLWRNFNHKKEYTYTTLHWHHSAVASLCFTPEGTNLLSGGVESVLVQWKYRENQRDFLPRLGASITHVAVSPDGALFCCSHSDNKITIIQNCVNVSAVIQGLVRGESARTDLMVDPRTKCLVLNGNPGHLQFYSLQRDKLLYNLDIVQQEFIHELGLQQFEVVNAAFDGPGNWLATVEERRRKAAELELNLKLWAFDEQTQSFVLNTTIVAPHDSQVTDLCFCRASDSQTTLLVSASKDGHFKAWQLAAQTEADGGPSWSCDFVGAYRGLVPECCCFSADGSLLAVSFQEVVTVWSPGSWELLTTLSQPPKSIRNLCFGRLSCSKYLVGTAGHNLLCCWNLLTCSLEWSTSMEVTLLLADPHSDNMAAFCWQDKCTDLFVFKPSEPRPLFSHKAVCSGKVSRAVFAPREEMLESCEESSQWLNRSQLCFLTQNMDLMTFTTETEEEKLMASSKQLVIDDSVAMTPFYLLLGKHRCQTLEMRDKESSWGSAERTPLPKGSVAVKELLQTPAHVLPPTSVLCAMFVESLLVSVTDSREEDEPEEEEMEGENEEDSEENVALRAEPAPLGREMVDSAPLTKAQTRELRRLVKLDHGWFSDLLDS
ncbi:WD repeat-containing protein 75 isoform X1 [Takifugu rubripes]|uniref:WD repeat domain 75 n=1 Tax=Takifugu rubripes TaxID=31033 RepID=A0A3B5JY96_TAKRU|nr:WD repeat-containing protein 75 isoform X1 [Takifugu rubripes]|eukprot:XP_003962243.1 PREDICTED: WD repeat-containing protein 75 isoform X1 [Takifugu rubripes]